MIDFSACILFFISGEKFPWTIKAANFAVYSIHHSQRVYYLLKPMAISTTLALTANEHPASESPDKASIGLGIHTDMPAVVPQVLRTSGNYVPSSSLKIITPFSKALWQIVSHQDVNNKTPTIYKVYEYCK